jgi:hypothetical protein
VNELEKKIMAMLLAGDDPALAVLRSQADAATVASREFSGAGFFTTFKVPENTPRLQGVPRLVIGDVYATIDGLEHEAGFLLFVADGAIEMLECFIVDPVFPPAPRLLRAYYVRPARPGGGEVHETQVRDLTWALRR